MVQHIRLSNNKSLLARIYGLYTLITNVFEPLSIIIMQNTKYVADKKSAQLTFDIKGSSHGRLTRNVQPNEFKRWQKGKCTSKILKDINFLRIQKDSNYNLIKIDEDEQIRICAQIAMDS